MRPICGYFYRNLDLVPNSPATEDQARSRRTRFPKHLEPGIFAQIEGCDARPRLPLAAVARYAKHRGFDHDAFFWSHIDDR
jgi:hypothetical protein